MLLRIWNVFFKLCCLKFERCFGLILLLVLCFCLILIVWWWICIIVMNFKVLCRFLFLFCGSNFVLIILFKCLNEFLVCEFVVRVCMWIKFVSGVVLWCFKLMELLWCLFFFIMKFLKKFSGGVWLSVLCVK